MKPSACLIRRTTSSYLVSFADAPELQLDLGATSPDELALAVLDLLQSKKKEQGDARSRIVYCPDPRSTLFATGEFGKETKPSDKQQLKYLAESLLPLDAEEMAADFIVKDSAYRILAADQAALLPLVEAFHQQGLHFRWIAPAPLLALQQALGSFSAKDGVIVWDDEDHSDAWWLDAAGPLRWSHMTGDESSRASALRVFAAQLPDAIPWTLLNSTKSTKEVVQSFRSVSPHYEQTESQATWLKSSADRLIQGTNTAWFDLRDGIVAGADRWRSLYGWMALASTAAIAMLIAFPVACWWKSSAIVGRLEAIEQAEQDLFRRAFPGQPIPDDVAGFISLKHLEARGARDGGGQISPTISAIQVLHAALTALSEEQDFVVEQLDIENGELNSKIRLKTFEAVPPLTLRLQTLGIQVQTPESVRNPDGTVTATLRGPMRIGKTVSKPVSPEPSGTPMSEMEVKL